MTVRCRLELTLTVRSPFLFPGLANGRLGLDATQLRDELGNAVLPAAQVQGLLREALNDLAAAAPTVITAEQLRDLFGNASPEAAVDGEYDQPNRGRLLLGDLITTEHPPGTDEITRVEIDDATGAAQTGHLQMIERVAPLGADVTFRGEAMLLWPDQTAKAVVAAIDRALRLIASIGAFKSAGFGEVRDAGAVCRDMRPVVLPVVAVETPEQVWLAAVFDRPILVDAQRVVDNAFVGAEIVPGAVFKGALARKLALIEGVLPAEYDAALACMLVSHAFPEDDTGAPGGEKLPLSSIAVSSEAGLQFGDALDVAGARDVDNARPLIAMRGPMIGTKAGWFQADWKEAWRKHARVAFARRPYTPPEHLPRTHTAIGAEGVAADQQLFTTVARSVLCPSDPAQPRRFLLRLDLGRVPGPDRTRAARLVALLREGLDGIGRTGASVRFQDWPEGVAAAPSVAPVFGQRDLFAVVLRTDAVLTDPLTPVDAVEAYGDYWKAILPAARLVDFYAAQHLAGGYLATRHRPWGKDTYHPFVVTNAGSVFLLDGQIAADLETMVRHGLPLPPGGFTGAAALNWRNCPFVPENGYGAIRADYLSEAANEDLTRAVRHV